MDARWVQWAERLLLEGADTPHLVRLAGWSDGWNQFELGELVDRVLEELGVEPCTSSSDACMLLRSVVADQALRGERSARDALAQLRETYIALRFPIELLEASQFAAALDGLEKYGNQYDVRGMNANNAEEFLRDAFRRWLAERPLP